MTILTCIPKKTAQQELADIKDSRPVWRELSDEEFLKVIEAGPKTVVSNKNWRD